MRRAIAGWLLGPVVAALLIVPTPLVHGERPAGSLPPTGGTTLEANASAQMVSSSYSCGQGTSTFALYANATGGTPPYQFLWQFGDGSSNSTQQNPRHDYHNVFGFLANLTVTDASNAVAHASVSEGWGTPLVCSNPSSTGYLGYLVYGVLVVGVVAGIVLVARGRRRRPDRPPPGL